MPGFSGASKPTVTRTCGQQLHGNGCLMGAMDFGRETAGVKQPSKEGLREQIPRPHSSHTLLSPAGHFH